MVSSLFNAFMILGSNWVLWVLIATSILSLAVVLERFRNLRNQEKLGEKLWKDHVESWMAGRSSVDLKQKATEILKSYPCVEGKLVDLLANQKAADSADSVLLVKGFLGKHKIELEKNLNFLGTVGSNAPFIGLFGTVLGIIKAFHDLGGQVESAGGAHSISAGISEALVATAVGLLVAIPAVIFYNYFQKKVDVVLGRAESLGNFLSTRK